MISRIEFIATLDFYFCLSLQLAFRSVQQAVQELRGKMRHILNLPVVKATAETVDDPIAMEMERHIEEYLCKTFDRFDVLPCIEVKSFNPLPARDDFLLVVC